VCLQTLEGHNREVNLVAFSPDLATLASTSWDSTVKIWDASTGACLQTLEGYINAFNSVAFSHDSARLATASWDRTVKIWDASSGACLQTLGGRSGALESVAFSPDSTRLASALEDKTVKIWDTSSGACLQIFQVDKTLHNLSFDCTGSLLYTTLGTIALQSMEGSSTRDIEEFKRPLYVTTSLSPDSIWIKHAGENLLWIPSEYRSSCWSVNGSIVGIGVGSGRIWFCIMNL
jgi:WD40 repeat protein